MSRKLIFAAGLLTCFSCQLNDELQSKISTDQRDIKGARNLNLAYLQEHILRRISTTPLNSVASAVMEYKIDKSLGKDLFTSYDEFLRMMNDSEKRSHLKKLRAEDSRNDSVFKEVQGFSECFSEALTEMFFSSPCLKDLTRKYGVF